MTDPIHNRLTFIHYADNLIKCVNKDLLGQITCLEDHRSDRLRSEVKRLLSCTKNLELAMAEAEKKK